MLSGLIHDPRIECDPEAVSSDDASLGVERFFTDCRDVALHDLRICKPQRSPVCDGPPPAGLVGHRPDHRLGARIVLQKIEAELYRLDPLHLR